MRIKNIKDPEAFFKTVESCNGRVELVTDEGDCLNLKSKLCQLVSLKSIFSLDSSTIPDLQIVAYEPEDVQKLIDYMARE